MFFISQSSGRSVPEELLLIAPLLALSTTVVLGLSAGLIFTVSLILVAVILALVRNLIAWQVRLPCMMLVIAAVICLLDMYLTAWFYDLRQHLGIYLPLLAINSLVFATSEEYFLRMPVTQSSLRALRIGLVITLLFLAAGTVRELLTWGTLFQNAGLIFPGTDISLDLVASGTAVKGLAVMGGAPGAFVSLGLVLGLWNYLCRIGNKHQSIQGQITGIEQQ